MTRKNNIWVEKLGVLDLLVLFFETFFSRASVRYDEKKTSTVAASVLAILQSAKLANNFCKAKLTLNKKNSSGYALNYSMENDLDICLNRFCDTYIKNESARFKGAARLYITTYLTYRSTFVTMVESEIEFKDTGIANTLYLRRNPINSVVIPYYREKGYAVRESISLSECFAQYLKPFYRLLSIVAAKLSFGMTKTSIVKARPSIWVEYAHDNGSDCAFWREDIDETRFDIAYYLDRHEKIPFGEQTAAIEKQRLAWIDLHFYPLVKLSRIGIKEIIDMAGAFFSCPAGFPLWFRVFRFDFRMWYLLYKPVFQRFKVKVLLQHQEALWIKEPQVAALEAAGGIMLGFHWSNTPYYKGAFWSHPQHIYFVWGKMMYEWIEKRGNISRHVLPAGLWLSQSRESVGTGCLKDGLAFVLAIFDSSVAYNIYQSEDTLAEFYLKMLSMLENNPGWGGIVKSKNWKTIHDLEFLPRGKEIVSRASSLMKEKRLVFLDNRLSPVSASAYADISVCYAFNSAGVISSMRGYKAIHWDCSGWRHHSIHRDPGQKIVYQDLEKLEEAIYKASAGDASIGDFSKWRKAFNYFDDDNTGARVGGFIQSYMDDVIKSGDAIKSLDKAAKKYVEDNNVGDDFFKNSGYWEDESCDCGHPQQI